MKNKILLVFAVLCCTAAFAEPVKVKFNDLAELGAALRVLDGAEKPIQTTEGTRVIRLPLDLKASVRIAVAHNLAAVRTALDAFEQQRQLLLQSVSPGSPQKVATEGDLLAKFVQKWAEVIKEPVTLDFQIIPEDQMNLEVNKEITGSVLAGLAPVLKR